MKEWLNMKSTLLGIIAVAIATIDAYQSGGSTTTILLGALGALGLTLKDTQK